MLRSTSNELVLGLLVGTAGISLFLWYCRGRRPRASAEPPVRLPPGPTHWPHKPLGGPEVMGVSQGQQLHILDKLDELVTHLEALRAEVRALKEALPRLEEYIQGELGGKAALPRTSPQHRARKRRLVPGQQHPATSNSSEEAESEGGCNKEKQYLEAASQASSHKGPTVTAHAAHPPVPEAWPVPRLDNSPARSREASPYRQPCPSTKSQSHLRLPCQRSSASLSCQQSRANFDPEKKRKSTLYESSCPRLTVVNYPERPSISSLKPSVQSLPGPPRSVGRLTSLQDSELNIDLVSPERDSTPELRSQAGPAPCPATAGCQLGPISFLSFLSVDSFFLKDCCNTCRATANQGPQSGPQVGCSGQPWTTGVSEGLEGAVLELPRQAEERASPSRIPPLRYNTANTDTEEQDFPVTKQLNTYIEELSLDDLLRKADHLRTNDSGKKESFELLYYHREKFRDEIEFIWRLARAYGDMCELSTDVGEKKHYANVGKTLGEKAVSQAPTNGYCHLWYAVLCGHVSEFEGLQNKINYGHCFKKHLDKAIEFLPEEPYLYYLRGRYCYAVSRLSWIERRMAATLFGIMPTSTVTEALQDFLKAEELRPGFSKYNYVFLAKCYVDLDSVPEALKFCDLAQLLPCVSREDEEAESQARAMLGSLSKR